MQTGFDKRLAAVTNEVSAFAARIAGVRDRFSQVASNSTKLGAQLGQVQELISEMSSLEDQQKAKKKNLAGRGATAGAEEEKKE